MVRVQKIEKSLNTAMFLPNPTARGYQGYPSDITGYQGLLYTGYHELSPLYYGYYATITSPLHGQCTLYYAILYPFETNTPAYLKVRLIFVQPNPGYVLRLARDERRSKRWNILLQKWTKYTKHGCETTHVLALNPFERRGIHDSHEALIYPAT